MEDTEWTRLVEGYGTWIVNWNKAPKGAQFYSQARFRKYIKGVEHFWSDLEGKWCTTVYQSIEYHSQCSDFELSPMLSPDYDGYLDDKWDSGDLGKDEEFVKVSDISINTPIKSDGGSSSYYDIQLPDWLIDLIVERKYIKTEELIEVLGSDFDLGNIIKCAVRINSLKNGVGKAGNDIIYDANKIIYSAGRLKERDKR